MIVCDIVEVWNSSGKKNTKKVPKNKPCLVALLVDVAAAAVVVACHAAGGGRGPASDGAGAHLANGGRARQGAGLGAAAAVAGAPPWRGGGGLPCVAI